MDKDKKKEVIRALGHLQASGLKGLDEAIRVNMRLIADNSENPQGRAFLQAAASYRCFKRDRAAFLETFTAIKAAIEEA